MSTYISKAQFKMFSQVRRIPKMMLIMLVLSTLAAVSGIVILPVKATSHSLVFQAPSTPTPSISALGHSVITASNVNRIVLMKSWQSVTTTTPYLTFSPDSNQLVSSGDDAAFGINQVRIWDIFDGYSPEEFFKGIRSFVPGVTAAHFSPDGQYLVANLGGNTVVWNSQNGTEVTRFTQRGTIEAVFVGNSNLIVASKDGLVTNWNFWDWETLVSASQQEAPLPNYFLAEPRVELVDAFHTDEPLSGMVFDPENERVLVLAESGVLNIFSVKSFNGALQAFQEAPQETATKSMEKSGIVFRPNHKTIAYITSDGNALLWDYVDREIITRYAFKQPVSCMAFSPDGNLLIIAERDVSGSLHILDANDGKSLRILQAGNSVEGCTFSPDGKLVATGSLVGGFIEGKFAIWGIP